MVVSKEVQTFVRACEHLLSVPSSLPLSDIEGDFVNFYIRELTNKYGVPKEEDRVRGSHVTFAAKTSR